MDCISKNYKCLTDSSTRFLLLFLSQLLLSCVESQRSPAEDENQYARFNPSMAIIMVVLVGALFVLGFFSIYVRRCSEDGGGGSQHAGGLFPGTQRSGRGLDADVLETFPMFTYSSVKGFKMGKGALECAICLNEFADEETIRLIPNCDHVFHAECIDAWLQNNVTCPVCRSNLTQLARDLEEININQPVERDEVVLNRIKSIVRPKSAGFRSHSTGHSVVGEDTERFTLRLPEEVRNKMISNALVMNRSGGMGAGEGSGRKGYMEGSSSWGRISYRRMMSDGWVFSRPPSFLSRALSQREKATTSADNIPLNNLAPKSDAHPPV